MKSALLLLIRAYRAGVSPALGARCRFEPSCSQYAYEAIEAFGSRRGVWMASKRLLRCRPGHPGGYDPVVDRDGVSISTNDAAKGLGGMLPHGEIVKS